MPNKRWTDEDIEDLRGRVAAGEQVRTIAAQIGRSQEATRARMQTLGLTRPRAFRAEQMLAQACTQHVLDVAEQ